MSALRAAYRVFLLFLWLSVSLSLFFSLSLSCEDIVKQGRIPHGIMTFMCHKNMLHAFVVHAADVHTCVCVRRELKSVTYSCIDTCVCACVFTAVSATHSLAYKNSTLSPRTDPAHPPATYRCTLYARNPSWGISKCCCCQ